MQTDIEVAHPDVFFYDFYGTCDNPIPEDKGMYLSEPMAASTLRKNQPLSDNRTGILTQATPNLGPIVSTSPESFFWQRADAPVALGDDPRRWRH